MPGFDLSGRNRLVVYRRPLATLDAAVRQRYGPAVIVTEGP
jgi:hypothetical protein